MKKVILAALLLVFCIAAKAETENTAVSFTAYPGIYIAGEDFPAGSYEIQCAEGTSLINIDIEDADGKKVMSGGFWASEHERLGKIDLTDGCAVRLSDGCARFSPTTGGIVFDEDTTAASEDGQAYEALVLPAIEALKAHWKSEYEHAGISESGYLEIKNTRIIFIQDGISSSNDEQARKYFGDAAYFIEFILFTDYYGSAPYYENAWVGNCVTADKNGALTVTRDPLGTYRARTYNSDYSGIIREIADLGAAYNAAYRLLEK